MPYAPLARLHGHPTTGCYTRYTRYVALCLLSACAILSGAVGQEQARLDAAEHWQEQAEMIQPDPEGGPYVTGAHVWRGRADEDYMPFHQWELRINAGAADRSGWQLRVLPLDAHFQVQSTVDPQWVDLPETAAGAEATVSYKLNSTAVAAYRMELRLEPEAAALPFLAGNQQVLPQPTSVELAAARLAVSEPDFQYDERRRIAVVTCFLANLGQRSAEEVRLTVHFQNEAGETVTTRTVAPQQPAPRDEEGAAEEEQGPRLIRKQSADLAAEREAEQRAEQEAAEPDPAADTLLPGFANEQRFVFKKVPPFHTIAMTTEKKESYVVETVLEEGSGAMDLAIEALRIDADGVLHLDLRNATDAAIADLTVQLDLQDADGSSLQAVELSVAELAAGETRALTAETGPVDFSAYSIDFVFE